MTREPWLDEGQPTGRLRHGGNARNDEEITIVQGWSRVCPSCGNGDGARVERIDIRPTFQCECGYVWDGSKARFVGMCKIDGDANDDGLDALADRVFDRLEDLEANKPEVLPTMIAGADEDPDVDAWEIIEMSLSSEQFRRLIAEGFSYQDVVDGNVPWIDSDGILEAARLERERPWSPMS